MSRRALVTLCFVAGALAHPTLARAEAWSEDSDPFAIDPRFDAHFASLPLAADLPPSAMPWSGPFWSDRKGSIGFRWRTGETLWKITSPTRTALLAMNPEKRRATIAALSAAEKIDLARDRYDYPTLAIVRGYASPNDPRWKGACTGWSQSALNYAEPTAVTRMNADGFEIPFGPGDLKALAAFYYDFVAVSEDPENGYDDRTVAQIGRRCYSGDARANCRRDLNPGALHILLANRIGLAARGVIADFSRGPQIWQHPIFGYSAEVRAERSARARAAPNAVREVRVHLDLRYADYAEAGSDADRRKARGLDYWLELDGDGRIVGGRYTAILPGKMLDYAWVSDALHFERGYEILNEMLTPRRPRGTDSSPFTFPAEIRPGG